MGKSNSVNDTVTTVPLFLPLYIYNVQFLTYQSLWMGQTRRPGPQNSTWILDPIIGDIVVHNMLAVSRLSIQIGYLFSIAFVRTPIVGGTFFSGSITIGSSYQTNGSSITSKICWSFTGVSIPSIHQCYSVISGGVIGYCIDSLHQCGLLPYGISLLTPSTGCVSCYRRCCWTTSRTNSTLILLFPSEGSRYC